MKRLQIDNKLQTKVFDRFRKKIKRQRSIFKILKKFDMMFLIVLKYLKLKTVEENLII